MATVVDLAKLSAAVYGDPVVAGWTLLMTSSDGSVSVQGHQSTVPSPTVPPAPVLFPDTESPSGAGKVHYSYWPNGLIKTVTQTVSGSDPFSGITDA